MRSDVDSKRHKFAKDIRMKQHEHYFEMHRQPTIAELPTMVYLPIMLENQLYEDIEAIMDAIDLGCPPQQPNPTILKTIRQRYQHHNDPKIKLLMFKLLNRLQQWSTEDLTIGVTAIKQGREDMLKQIVLYLQVKMDKLSRKQKQQERKQQQEQLNKDLVKVFKVVLPMQIVDVENRIYWLDIVCKTIQAIPSCTEQCLKNMDAFMFGIDVGINNSNQFQLIRVFKIITQIATRQECQFKIMELNCFPKFLGMVDHGSIDLVLEGLEIIAQLMSNEQAIVYRMVHQFGVVKILAKYVDHIMFVVQSRVLWAISNITGSQHYACILNDKALLEKILSKTKNISHPEIRKQSYYCILNLLCSCNPEQVQYLLHNYHITDQIVNILRQFRQRNFSNDELHERLMYSIYHMLEVYGKCVINFEQFGLIRLLEELYQEEHDEKKVGMLTQILNLIKIKRNSI